ncbi:hypothetical protein NCC78_18245 [Micromonospora phytophila]|uniref:hypothetical protein n=1 Tax=Micromonospora phytophila TaxID=709888 RepID=UPI00202E5E2B|nr:hypothetical protein [Micromonospora phytophila]MCM0676612.1 hypothetical protein [Micromonospora phytophila]
MARTRRSTAALIATMLSIVGALAVISPASAGNAYIGVDGRESRCNNNSRSCLYYSTLSSAYWATTGGDSDLGNNYFASGTGSGAGQRVRNNAARMSCYYGVAQQCQSYFSPGYTGSMDWMFWGQTGQLYYTWNDEASMKVI